MPKYLLECSYSLDHVHIHGRPPGSAERNG